MKLATLSLSVFLLAATATAGAQQRQFVPINTIADRDSPRLVRFSGTSGIAIDAADNIYLAREKGQQAVQEITTAGEFKTLLKRPGAASFRGMQIAASQDGTIYLSVKSSSSIEMYDPKNGWARIAGHPGKSRQIDGPVETARLKKPGALTVGKDGTVYFADSQLIRSVKHGMVNTIAGKEGVDVLGLNGQKVPPDEERQALFITPISIAVTDDDKLFVIDNGLDLRESPQENFYQQFIELSLNGTFKTVVWPQFVVWWKTYDTGLDSEIATAFIDTDEDKKMQPDLGPPDEYSNPGRAANVTFKTISRNAAGHFVALGRSSETYLIRAVPAKEPVQQTSPPNWLELKWNLHDAHCALGSKDMIYCVNKDRLYRITPDGTLSALAMP